MLQTPPPHTHTCIQYLSLSVFQMLFIHVTWTAYQSASFPAYFTYMNIDTHLHILWFAKHLEHHLLTNAMTMCVLIMQLGFEKRCIWTRDETQCTNVCICLVLATSIYVLYLYSNLNPKWVWSKLEVLFLNVWTLPYAL